MSLHNYNEFNIKQYITVITKIIQITVKTTVLMLTFNKWLKSEFDSEAKEIIREVNKVCYCW